MGDKTPMMKTHEGKVSQIENQPAKPLSLVPTESLRAAASLPEVGSQRQAGVGRAQAAQRHGARVGAWIILSVTGAGGGLQLGFPLA